MNIKISVIAWNA